MKKKLIKRHSHIKRASSGKSTWKTSTWTFSIITVGIALLILALVVSVKQNLQVLGSQTSVPYNSTAK